MNMKHQIVKYTGMLIAAIFAMTSLSCERDVFWVNDSDEIEARPVNITLGFEVPQYGEETVTRTLSPDDEHHINNFQLLIFQSNKATNPDPSECYCVYNHLFQRSELTSLQDFEGNEDDWVSVEALYNGDLQGKDADKVRSTNGYVVLDNVPIDPSKGCFIFGFANVATVDNDSEGKSITAVAYMGGQEYATVGAALDAIVPKTSDNQVSYGTLAQLKEMQVQLNNLANNKYTGGELDGLLKESILNREYANLLYSGAWSTWAKKITGNDGSQHNFYEDLSGFVSPSTFRPDVNSYDLRGLGMIYLRSLVAHVKFEITFDEEVFEDFRPESWEVVHVPVRSYFLDRTNETKLSNTEESYFGRLEPVQKMTHTGAHYEFDFYMYENERSASDIDNLDVDDIHTLIDTDLTSTKGYYDRFYGDDMMTIPGITPTAVDPNQLYYAVYGYGYDPQNPNSEESKNAKKNFLYAKRELELKCPGSVSAANAQYRNKVIKNLKGETNSASQTYGYESKKFVYSEPKATYVIVKGRLLLNTNNKIKLKNLAGFAEYDEETGAITSIQATNIDDVTDGYADVTYTIHLGYVGQKDTNGAEVLNPAADFNVLRNTNYLYKVHIAGINSILTNVIADLQVNIKDESKGKYRVKYQPGADGNLNLAMGTIYNLDAHYNQFNFMLTKAGLNNFVFEIHTPWGTYTSDQVRHDIQTIRNRGIYNNDPTSENYWFYKYKDDEIYEKYLTNPDFTWFKFTPTYDQRGIFAPAGDYVGWEDSRAKNRETTRYNPNSENLWNLFDFMVQMELLGDLSNTEPDYLEDGQAIKQRIISTLSSGIDCLTDYGAFANYIDPSTKEMDITHADHKPLPYLLDIRTYELTDTPEGATKEMKYAKIEANYQKYLRSKGLNNSLSADNPGTESEYFFKYKRPYKTADGRLMVEENYIEFLREYPQYPGDGNPNYYNKYTALDDSKKIHRMFYTAYVDEYFYPTPPKDANGNYIGWSTPYWKEFVNKPSRYISFGYQAEDGSQSSIMSGTSLDGQSSLTTTQLTILQSSIQTFYNGEGDYALGVERVNETHDPRWADKKTTIPTTGFSASDGWENTKAYMCSDDSWEEDNGKWYTSNGRTDDDTVWGTYVSDKLYDDVGDGMNPGSAQNKGFYFNVTMNRNLTIPLTNEQRLAVGADTDDNLPFYAGALRMCMNRNRDENGNGKIDEDELKWYLPTSNQMDVISMCHYSLDQPLFNYNDYYDTSVPDPENQQRLPMAEFPSLNFKNFYKFHYVTSDYMIAVSEEMMNSSPYEEYSKPYEMRCVRNLNDLDLRNESNEETIKTLVTNSNKTPDENAVKVYEYNTTTHVFEMKYLDSRSIRGIIYSGRELPTPHYLFSATDLPYHRFQVSTNYNNLKQVVSDHVPDGNKRDLTYVVKNAQPCHYYSETDLNNGPDLYTWRAPNFVEMGLMIVELRAQNKISNEDNDFFRKVSDTDWWASATSWNFTGPLGRVEGVRWQGHWDVTTSPFNPNSTNRLYNNPWGTSSISSGRFFIRCVKDLPK